jgi:hypothetical protein
MDRIIVPSRLVAVSLLLVSGCLRPMDGTLTVSEPFAVNASKRAVQLLPGYYPVRVLADDDDGVTLRIERRPGDVVTARLTTRMRQDTAGGALVPSAENGQPFDLVYRLASDTQETPLQSSVSPCRVETPEIQCRTTTAPEFGTGSIEPREVCSTQRVLRHGRRIEQSVRATEMTTVSGRMLDPASGRELALLSARAERERTYWVTSDCR